MRGKTIDLFMWGYQIHFAADIRRRAEELLEQIGAPSELRLLLVGVRRPDCEAPHPVCVEPEDGDWKIADFEGLDAAVEEAYRTDDGHRMFYGDQRATDAKPENIRRKVVVDQVKARIDAVDAPAGWRNFCAPARPIGCYYIVTVLQLRAGDLARYPEFEVSWHHGSYRTNFLLCCIDELLDYSQLALQLPEPGGMISGDIRSAEEMVRRAASKLMMSPFIEGQSMPSYLFDGIDDLSKTPYEGDQGIGRLYIARDDNTDFERLLTLAVPVRIRETRWARKMLQMAAGDVGLLADTDVIYALGRPLADRDRTAFTVDFLGRHQWDLRRGDDILMRVQAGEARLPSDRISHSRFKDNVSRVLPGTSAENATRLLEIYRLLASRPRGSLLVVASDAAAEAERLELQGSRIVPTVLTDELLDRAADIDGAILIAPDGVCHAIGVILDGPVNAACTPSRGGRYNSAVRYVSNAPGRLAFIVSDDQTSDVVPLLRPRVSNAAIEEAIVALEAATLENYHGPRMFVRDHAFYLDAGRCDRVNAALARIRELPRELGRIVIIDQDLLPDPGFNPSYLTD